MLSSDPKTIVVHWPQRGLKNANGRFCLKSPFAWRKSATKFVYVKTVSNKVVRHSLA